MSKKRQKKVKEEGGITVTLTVFVIFLFLNVRETERKTDEIYLFILMYISFMNILFSFVTFHFLLFQDDQGNPYDLMEIK